MKIMLANLRKNFASNDINIIISVTNVNIQVKTEKSMVRIDEFEENKGRI